MYLLVDTYEQYVSYISIIRNTGCKSINFDEYSTNRYIGAGR